MAGRREDEGLEEPRAPGWYPDPWSATGTGERYFDGQKWGSSERPLARHTAEEAARAPRRARRESPRREPVRHEAPRSHRLVGVVVVVALAGAFWAVSTFTGGDSDDEAGGPSANGGSPASNRPPPSPEVAASPLGAPARVPPGPGEFEMLMRQRTNAEVPVAFDPCRPVHYVYNPSGEPSDGSAVVQAAIASVSAASGLQFVSDGPIDEAPTKERLAFQPDRYPNRWAPVLIAWSDEAAFPSLAGYIAGVGTAIAVEGDNNQLVYVSGQVVLDARDLSSRVAPNRRDVRAVVMHELGHLVGLDHTADRNQLMFSENQFNVHEYGTGDRRGLALLGTQACFPDV